MSDPMQLLAFSREARRDSALAHLATAGSELNAAAAACAQANAEIEQSKQWRADVLAHCRLGEGQALRGSSLIACEALLQQRERQSMLAQHALRAAQERVAHRRKALMACERDSLRLQEWQQLERSRGQREQARLEERDAEEFQRPATRSVAF